MSNAELAIDQTQSNTGLSVFDSGQFEQMWVVAGAISQGTLVPTTLRGGTEEETKANCLRVVEQAQRWNMSPFAVIDCASVVHGRLMWEGKLVAAVIDSLAGVRLAYDYSGSGEDRKVIVSGTFADETEPRTIEGTVKDWKTTGKGSPWDKVSQRDQMLASRGARQWARRYAPAVMLGVYSPDEFDTSELKEAKARVLDGGNIEKPVTPSFTNEEPKKEEASKGEKVEPKGKQKKPRYTNTASLLGVTEKSTEAGKVYFVVTLNNGTKTVDMLTYSRSMGAALRELEKGVFLNITYTETSGQLQLENYELDQGGIA